MPIAVKLHFTLTDIEHAAFHQSLSNGFAGTIIYASQRRARHIHLTGCLILRHSLIVDKPYGFIFIIMQETRLSAIAGWNSNWTEAFHLRHLLHHPALFGSWHILFRLNSATKICVYFELLFI